MHSNFEAYFEGKKDVSYTLESTVHVLGAGFTLIFKWVVVTVVTYFLLFEYYVQYGLLGVWCTPVFFLCMIDRLCINTKSVDIMTIKLLKWMSNIILV
jgi:hypothetical protein